MLKRISYIVILLLIMTTTVFAEEMIIKGEAKQIDSIIIDGRKLVPLRQLSEALSLDVTWYDVEELIVVTDNRKSLILQPDNIHYKWSTNLDKTTDVAPIILEGTTYLPLRVIAEDFGYEITIKEGITYIDERSPEATAALQKEREERFERVATKIVEENILILPYDLYQELISCFEDDYETIEGGIRLDARKEYKELENEYDLLREMFEDYLSYFEYDERKGTYYHETKNEEALEKAEILHTYNVRLSSRLKTTQAYGISQMLMSSYASVSVSTQMSPNMSRIELVFIDEIEEAFKSFEEFLVAEDPR